MLDESSAVGPMPCPPVRLTASSHPLLGIQAVDEVRQDRHAVALKYKKAAKRLSEAEQAGEKLGLELQHARSEVSWGVPWGAVVLCCCCVLAPTRPSMLSE